MVDVCAACCRVGDLGGICPYVRTCTIFMHSGVVVAAHMAMSSSSMHGLGIIN